jgi:16S rRNA (uracil1498-N3)-methyltransferase
VNTLLLEPGELAGAVGRAVVRDRRRHHVHTVHRAAVGERLRVGVVGGRLGEADIVALDDDRLELDVTLDRDPPPALPLTLVLALPRPKVLRRMLQAIAALGVKRVVLIATWRVERSYWQSPLLAEAAVREQLVLGLEQSGDTILPAVLLRRRFKPFVEDELDAFAADGLRLLAAPGAPAPCPRDVRAAVTLVVGPEGAFTAYELAMLQERRFAAVSLGPRVLRVEQVVPALIGRLF